MAGWRDWKAYAGDGIVMAFGAVMVALGGIGSESSIIQFAAYVSRPVLSVSRGCDLFCLSD